MRKFEKLYLHVGLEKTGTTSIQKILNKRRDRFEALGFYYPKQFAVGLNTLLAAMFLRNPMARPNFRRLINQHGGTQESHIEAMNAALSEELTSVEADNLVLSSEFLGAGADHARLKAWCDSLAKDTEVIIYLREQCSFLISYRSTYWKGGGVTEPFETFEEKTDFPLNMNAEAVLNRLEQVFPDKVTVRVFHPERLSSGDAGQDFIACLGLSEQADEFALRRTNESLSLVGAEFLKKINANFPPARNGKRNIARDGMIKDIGEIDGQGDYGKDTLSPDQVRKIQSIFKDGNEAVRARYFPKEKVLFPAHIVGEEAEVSPDQLFKYMAEILEKAYADQFETDNLLIEIARYLNKLSKLDGLGEEAENLMRLNKKIHESRKP